MTEAHESPVRWALAGYGSGGRVFHAPLIQSTADLELTAVVTSSPDRRAQVAQNLPGVLVVGAIEDLPGLGIGGVTISTPSATHAELAHRALDAGLNVVVDKPFAMTTIAAKELVDHAHRVGRMITAYQNRRWDSDFLTIRALLDSGVLGTVHRFTSRIDRFRPVRPGWGTGGPEAGNGTLLDLGPHLIDQALVLFGPVDSVYAELSSLRPGFGAEDDIVLSLRHSSGVRSTLIAGMASAAPGPRFQINGSAGGFVIDGFDVQESQLKSGHSPATLGADWGVEPESAHGLLVIGETSSTVPSERGRWDTFYPAVAAAVLGTGSPPVDPAAAVRTAAVIDAARRSAELSAAVAVEAG